MTHPNKCTECGKVLRSHNKSMLCNFHVHQKYFGTDEYRNRKREYNKSYSLKNNRREYSNLQKKKKHGTTKEKHDTAKEVH